jgi:ATP-binding cassette subfamily F protein uup
LRSPVKALSGGERNRLMLARLFTRPANVLVLDEPTNDLDLETLELLEEQLLAFPGTILLVSHDRSFLDNVVTSTFVFEGNAHVEEYIGGYDDWLHQRTIPAVKENVAPPRRNTPPVGAARVDIAASVRKKLSYIEQREFDHLPERIEALESEQQRLNAMMAAPDFYKESAGDIGRLMTRLEESRRELLDAYALWDDLDSRAQ